MWVHLSEQNAVRSTGKPETFPNILNKRPNVHLLHFFWKCNCRLLPFHEVLLSLTTQIVLGCLPGIERTGLQDTTSHMWLGNMG